MLSKLLGLVVLAVLATTAAHGAAVGRGGSKRAQHQSPGSKAKGKKAKGKHAKSVDIQQTSPLECFETGNSPSYPQTRRVRSGMGMGMGMGTRPGHGDIGEATGDLPDQCVFPGESKPGLAQDDNGSGISVKLVRGRDGLKADVHIHHRGTEGDLWTAWMKVEDPGLNGGDDQCSNYARQRRGHSAVKFASGNVAPHVDVHPDGGPISGDTAVIYSEAVAGVDTLSYVHPANKETFAFPIATDVTITIPHGALHWVNSSDPARSRRCVEATDMVTSEPALSYGSSVADTFVANAGSGIADHDGVHIKAELRVGASLEQNVCNVSPSTKLDPGNCPTLVTEPAVMRMGGYNRRQSRDPKKPEATTTVVLTKEMIDGHVIRIILKNHGPAADIAGHAADHTTGFPADTDWVKVAGRRMRGPECHDPPCPDVFFADFAGAAPQVDT